MSELDRAWARTQVEAMVDGRLSPEAGERMRALMSADPDIAREVERARLLRGQLRALRRVPVPRGLGRRLWQIPERERRRPFGWVPAAGIAAVASVAVAVSVFLGVGSNMQQPTGDDLARDAALQDFAIAMAYLQKSALVARNEVNEAVGAGVMDALAASRGAIGQRDYRSSEGE